MPDAVIDKTVDGIIGSAFGAAGQRCMAGSVVVTVGDAHEQLMRPLVEATARAARRRRPRRVDRRRPGDLVRRARPHRAAGSSAARPTARSWSSTGGGRRRGRPRALVRRARRSSTASPPTMDIAQEEVFGPVLSVIQAATLDEAIEIVNSQPVRQRHLDLHRVGRRRSARYRHEVEAGMIGVNIGVAAPVAFFPFSRLEGLLPRRPARPRHRRGRLLHAQEDRDQPLLLERPGQRGLLRGALTAGAEPLSAARRSRLGGAASRRTARAGTPALRRACGTGSSPSRCAAG